MRFPYAALQLLCGPLRDHLGGLPAPQRDVLATAVGAGTGSPPDPFPVGLAVLGLLSRVAQLEPLLCVIDDAQWIDGLSAQVLAFVARRLDARPVMLLLGRRDAPRVGELDGLPELQLQPLSPTASRTLLARMLPGRVDEPVVERTVTEARGNPLAVLELARATAPADLAGGFGVPAAGGPPGRTAEAFLDRVGRLPPPSQQLLLLAAAEPIGDPALLWRSAAVLGIPPEAAEALESRALLEIGPRVAFARPLLRSVVYGVATNDERRGVHRALASATDPASDPVRRTWHQAHAADRPDDELAEALVRCAPTARQRGGPAAAAAFLEKATLLTGDPRRRVGRALAAAAAAHEAGADLTASSLLGTAELGPLDDRQQARVDRQRARLTPSTRGGDDAPELLLRAARQLEPLDPALARETYLEALAATISAGRLGLGRSVEDVAKAAQAGPPAPRPSRALDHLLDGLAVRFTRGCSAAAQPLGRALRDVCRTGTEDPDAPWRRLASPVAAELWDDEAWHRQTALDLRLVRGSGAVAALPAALDNRAVAELHFGDLSAAAVLVEEAAAVSTATGATGVPHASLLLAAWRGRPDQALELFQEARRDAVDRGEGRTLATVGLATAVLHNSLGRHDEALAAARAAGEWDDLGLLGWTLAELVEAAVRAGEPTTASLALERLAGRTRLSGTDWALGIEARSRALVSDGPAAEDLFREAIGRLGRSRIRSSLARTELLYGEWLRRRGRRVDARGPLRAARGAFEAMGAVAFAERAQRELLATGEKARSRSVDSGAHLTPQEARIAALARDGLSNPAIGARIFVSPRTVEYHLHKVFAKLGIRSRNELHIVLPRAADPAPSRRASGPGTPVHSGPTRPAER